MTTTLKDFLLSLPLNDKKHQTIGCYQSDLQIDATKHQEFQVYMGKALREAYIDSEYLAKLLKREGFDRTTRLIQSKFPPTPNIDKFNVRLGDFGEVMSHVVLQDFFSFIIPIIKLRYKTNSDKAVFGIDVIAFKLHENPIKDKDRIVFAEVKTAYKSGDYGVKTVFEEVDKLLQPEARQKVRNAVVFICERLFEKGNLDLEERLRRFLDCYSKPEYIEFFAPFLIRESKLWKEKYLDGIKLNNIQCNKVKLCVVLIDGLETVIETSYQLAGDLGGMNG